MTSGFLHELRSFSDFAYDRLSLDELPPYSFPLGRMKEADTQTPILFQGDSPFCVPCSVLWIAKWLNLAPITPSLGEFLSGLGPFSMKGYRPSKVLETARSLGLIRYYSYLSDPNDQSVLDDALARTPLMIGLWNWALVPNQGHMMVLIDRLANGDFLCVNWQDQKKTDFVVLPRDTRFTFAASFAGPTGGILNFVPWPSFFGNIIRNIPNIWRVLMQRLSL